MQINYLQIVLILIVMCSNVSGQRKSCPVTIAEADTCARKLMFEGDRTRFVPRNNEQMDEHCSMMTENIKCIERHSRCYKPFAKQVFGTALFHLKKAHKRRCLTPEGRQEFLFHMGCIKDEKASEPAHQCSDKWSIMIQTISSNFSSNQHFPAFCCSFHLFRECLLTRVNDLCKNTTGPGTAKYIEGSISDAVADFMDLACNKHANKEQCATNLPRGFARLQKIFNRDIPPQNTSPLFHFLQFAIKYDQ